MTPKAINLQGDDEMVYKRFEDAACAILEEKQRHMRCHEIIKEVIGRSLWARRPQSNPKTLYNSLYGTLIKATKKSHSALMREGNTDIFYVLGRSKRGSTTLEEKRKNAQQLSPDQIEQNENEQFEEGDVREITLELKKRDKKIKKLAIERYGLCCQVCGFNFYEMYGSLGSGYIEVHHLVPLSKQQGKVTTTVNDVAIVCANCHRILHRIEGRQLSIESLRESIKGRWRT